MSLTQPNSQTSRPDRRKRVLLRGGVALLAALCAAGLVMAVVFKVQDEFDRTH
jgi:hypothetical protein